MEKTRSNAVKFVREWSDENDFRYVVAADLQPLLAKVTGYELCIYCSWVMFPGEPHTYCEDELIREMDLEEEAWKRRFNGEDDILKTEESHTYCEDEFIREMKYPQLEAKPTVGLENVGRICTCGAPPSRHYRATQHCFEPGCDCKRFVEA